jgi:hypothetical protein
MKNIYTIEINKINFATGQTITLPEKIYESLLIENILIVAIAQAKNNVFGIDTINCAIRWQIDTGLAYNCRLDRFLIKDNILLMDSTCNHIFYVNHLTGEILKEEVMWDRK